ncbi:MAG TPA: hydantoinase/oxoprolinase family protein, partial [Rhodopila sp.]
TTYARLFGRIIPGLEIEAVTWTLALSQPYELPAAVLPVATRTPAKPSSIRRMVEAAGGQIVDAPVYTRSALRPGARLSGPAAIVEDGTTSVVPVGFRAHIAAGGEIVIEEGSA